MTNAEKTSNIFGIFGSLEVFLNSGDPVVREWFMVKSNFWPLFLCSMYLLIVKWWGPSFMGARKPLKLRKTMIVYNLLMVLIYSTGVASGTYGIAKSDFSMFCKNSKVSREDYSYMVASWGWVVYMLKYVEFFDTFFLVLRKKESFITNLHVIHHASMPFFAWILARTEKSGFLAFPIVINSAVHIAMYSYYGLAAIGPSVRRYLWWKRYLTLAQMAQFILILVHFVVAMPLLGCTSTNSTFIIFCFCAVLFFVLFRNFYMTSFAKEAGSKHFITFNSSQNGASKIKSY